MRQLFILIALSVTAAAPLHAQWSRPVDVSSETLNVNVAQGVLVTVDAAGDAVAGWSEIFAPSDNQFQTATQSVGADWTTPITLSTTPTPGGNDFDLSTNASGETVAVWAEGNTAIIRASELPLHGSWTAPITISAVSSIGTGLPSVAMDPTGNAVAMWVQFNPTQIVQSNALISGTWTGVLDIPSSFPATPDVGVDAAGNAVGVWANDSGAPLQIEAATLAFGASAWSTVVGLSDPADDSRQPIVAVAPFGYAVAIWVDETLTQIQAATKPFGGAWTTAVTISGVGASMDNFDLGIDANGDAVAVWQIGGVVQVSTLPFGGSWTTPVDVPDTTTARVPRISVDPAGDAVIVWIETTTFGFVVEASAVPYLSTPSTPVQISSSGTIQTFAPDVAIDASGDAVAVWIRANSTGFFVVQSARSSGLFPAPPTNFRGIVLTDRFLTQTAEIVRLTWTPSSAAGLVEYLLSRNGQLIATLPATATSFEERHHVGQTDVYTLQAVTSSGAISSSATTTVS